MAAPTPGPTPGPTPAPAPGPAPGLTPAVEAVLLVADQPLTADVLAGVLDGDPAEVDEVLRSLARSYDDEGRGFELRNVGAGWRLYTREEYADVVERFVLDGQQARLTQAALETLAVVAYRQPVSRSRVSAIRGVNVDGVMRTLLTRGLVEEAGTDTATGAVLYRTSGYFLERMGLTSVDELPDLAPYLPADDETRELVAELGSADRSAESDVSAVDTRRVATDSSLSAERGG